MKVSCPNHGDFAVVSSDDVDGSWLDDEIESCSTEDTNPVFPGYTCSKTAKMDGKRGRERRREEKIVRSIRRRI